MRKKLVVTVIVCFLVVVAGVCYWFYPRFYSPIFKLETGIPLNGKSYVTSKLIANDGSIYWEEKDADPAKFKFRRQIGRTKDGFEVFEFWGDAKHDEIMLTGFMFPQIVYKRE